MWIATTRETMKPMVEPLTQAQWQIPRLDSQDRWVGGVAAAVARELGVQPIVIRVSFLVLASVGGWGLIIYALCWAGLAIATPDRLSRYEPTPKAATPSHRHVAIAMITLGLVLFLLPYTSSVFRAIVWPVGLTLSGMLIAWTRSGDGGMSSITRVVAGLVFAIGGFLAFTALQTNLVETVVATIFGLAIIFGIVLVAAPSVVRMAKDLDTERQKRVRSDERARISAHIHDSVLQTLSVIQQNPDDPARTRQLARRQERELRNWLYGTPSSTPQGLRLGPALEYAASGVEDRFDVFVEVVAVGDTDDLAPTDLDALIASASEAMTNAAKHAGVSSVDVYAERRPNAIEVFIRDKGKGFDMTSIDSSRHGLADSIVGRMQRAGGTATIHSEVGSGTEVELVLPIETPDAKP